MDAAVAAPSDTGVRGRRGLPSASGRRTAANRQRAEEEEDAPAACSDERSADAAEIASLKVRGWLPCIRYLLARMWPHAPPRATYTDKRRVLLYRSPQRRLCILICSLAAAAAMVPGSVPTVE